MRTGYLKITTGAYWDSTYEAIQLLNKYNEHSLDILLKLTDDLAKIQTELTRICWQGYYRLGIAYNMGMLFDSAL
jgi:hypothetical protein